MKRRPRSPDEPVIARALGVRLGIAGLLIAVGTLLVVAWGEDRYGLAAATTMGLTTISLLHIVAALEWRDPMRSVFNRDTIANGRFNLLMVTALVLTFLATTIDGLQRILDTVDLDGHQWRVCLIAVIGYFVLAEVAKVVLRLIERRRAPDACRQNRPARRRARGRPSGSTRALWIGWAHHRARRATGSGRCLRSRPVGRGRPSDQTCQPSRSSAA